MKIIYPCLLLNYFTVMLKWLLVDDEVLESAYNEELTEEESVEC